MKAEAAPSAGEYIGTELELFANAKNWKAYFAALMKPYLRGRVLEVGAGVGTNTKYLLTPQVEEWTALEPDPRMALTLSEAFRSTGDPRLRCKNGTLGDLDPSESFDAILYVDVLEHIKDDLSEVGKAGALLKPGGHLIVLSPAHEFFFSEFDRAIGHYRRYNKASLSGLTPPHLKLESLLYLDSAGCLASFANKQVLKQGSPTLRQILFWDRVLTRFSKVLDPLLRYSLGKSILAVWKR